MMETFDIDERITNLIRREIEEQTKSIQEAANELQKWHLPTLDAHSFWHILVPTAQAFMAQRGDHRTFSIDEDNRDVIRQMWLYVKGDSECKWDINKGIYLGGKVGCGKTILIQSLCHILGKITGYNIEMISAPQLYKRIVSDGIKSLTRRPLIIDDIGREQKEINDFGNKIRPINELISLRYETGARTFFTSNFMISTLANGENGYGTYIGDRLEEMVTTVILPGESRRNKQKNE